MTTPDKTSAYLDKYKVISSVEEAINSAIDNESPNPMAHMGGVLLSQGNKSGGAGWFRITCPWFSVMYKNGYLVPDADGLLTAADVKEIALRSGGPKGLIDAVFGTNENGVVIFLDPQFPDKPDKINPFKFNGILEHGKSTGLRDPLPNWAVWEKFATFADANGDFSMAEVAAASKFYDQNPNDVNEEKPHNNVSSVFPLFFMMFTNFRDGAKLSIEAMRLLIMESVFPPLFKMLPASK